MEAETRVMGPQTKEHLEPPAGGSKDVSSPSASGRSTALLTPGFQSSGL